MCQKFTADELNIMDHETKNEVIYRMKDCLDKLEHDYENLIEQSGFLIGSVSGGIQKNWMTLRAVFLFQ